MRAQRFTTVFLRVSRVLEVGGLLLIAACTHPQGSGARPDYDARARQADDHFIRSQQATQQQQLAQKKQVLLDHLSQQEQAAKDAAERQALQGKTDVPLATRLTQIEHAFAQKRARLERVFAEEQARDQAIVDLERELSTLPE